LSVPTLEPARELRLLYAFFGDSALPQIEGVDADDVPEPYHRLLVHDQHMTVTLEAHHGKPVTVVPWKVHRNGDIYGRKLDLIVEQGRTVMTGVMLINFSYCTAEVRNAVIAETAPLGRILIENNVLRRIDATAFVKLPAEDSLVQRFHSVKPQAAYGRLATIYCDERPAIDLLEIVAPE
jgi:chorismate-pyruvate lyase